MLVLDFSTSSSCLVESHCVWVFVVNCYISFDVVGIMAMGAINVVRGMRSSDEELLQIYKHSERQGN